MSSKFKSRLKRSVAAMMVAGVTVAAAPVHSPTIDIRDAYLKAWHELTYDQPPPPPVPGKDYGMDGKTGRFIHPRATPLTENAPAFPGQLEHWDQNSYAKNVSVIAFYPRVTSPWHAWPDVADFGGRRYLYLHDRDYLRILDVTDPRKAKIVHSRGGVWGPEGPSEEFDAANVQDYFGGVTIAWNKRLGRNILVASYEIGRFGILHDKMREPDKVERLRRYSSLKGFKVFAMDGPLPHQWRLLATRTTDAEHPDAGIGEQRGSGSLDAPAYDGGKYMYLSSAPDDSYALTEYPDYLHSPGYQVWDMSDPANPIFVRQVTAPGQIVGDEKSEAAYLMNPRAGNRTSWMGSRMPLFLPRPARQDRQVAFGAMGGLGLYSFDMSSPDEPKIIGSLSVPPSFAGTEFDNIDTSQYARTGFIFANGYPMNSNCYEPYKDIMVIDARDPARLSVVAQFPRPTPPKEAGFSDYCQRRGSFGPKRSGTTSQPLHGRQGIVPYAFYNAGVQIFDVRDPTKPAIAGYFVPRFPTTEEVPEYTFENTTFGVFPEYDRNIIWAFTTNGIYALSSPLLGEPLFRAPSRPWPGRD